MAFRKGLVVESVGLTAMLGQRVVGNIHRRFVSLGKRQDVFSRAFSSVQENEEALMSPELLERQMSDSVVVSRLPGSRVFEMAHPLSGNLLSAETTSMLRDRVEILQPNTAVKALVFASVTPEFFSVGLASDANNEDLESMYEMSDAIKYSKTDTIVVYGGALTGTAFAAFADSKFRLGTPSFSFRINEIVDQGILPRGGLAHYFFRSSEEGKSFARYLAISGQEVRADDMFALNMITHLVEEDPHSSFTHALAHTVPNRAEEYRGPVRGDTIEEILDTMSVEDDLNIMGHEAWNEYVLVPPGRWDTQEKEVEVPFDERDVADLELVDTQAWIIQCFSDDRLSVCRDKLMEMATSGTDSGTASARWAAQCLVFMDSNDENVMDTWWRVTSSEVGGSLAKVRSIETEWGK